MQWLFPFFLITAFSDTLGQNYFQGQIIYHLELQKKDSSFDLSNIISYPATTFTFLFKEGIWINAPDSGIIDFGYFRYDENRQYYKFVGNDTLVYYDYSQPDPDQDSLLSIHHQYTTDTILGRTCNRLVLKMRKMVLTLVYSPLLSVNPDWFKNTKGAYYDIIYSNTKALYLMCILETDEFISRQIAIEVSERELSKEIFDNIHQSPKRPMATD
jgi:hypothetical protein